MYSQFMMHGQKNIKLCRWNVNNKHISENNYGFCPVEHLLDHMSSVVIMRNLCESFIIFWIAVYRHVVTSSHRHHGRWLKSQETAVLIFVAVRTSDTSSLFPFAYRFLFMSPFVEWWFSVQHHMETTETLSCFLMVYLPIFLGSCFIHIILLMLLLCLLVFLFLFFFPSSTYESIPFTNFLFFIL